MDGGDSRRGKTKHGTIVKRDWCSSKKRYDWRNAAVIDLEIIV